MARSALLCALLLLACAPAALCQAGLSYTILQDVQVDEAGVLRYHSFGMGTRVPARLGALHIQHAPTAGPATAADLDDRVLLITRHIGLSSNW